MPNLDLVIVCLAAFFAGNLNALAGGGSFITLPSLIFVGIPPVLANTTSAAALLPGYLGSVLGFRNLYKELDIKYLSTLILITSSAAILGAFLLINTKDEVFLSIVPWLILLATLLFILKPNLISKNKSTYTYQYIGTAIVSVYGGYFNGGLGIALLAVLSFGKNLSIKNLSAIKSLLSFLLTTVSVTVFFFNGFIDLSYVFFMMVFAAIGGFFGAKLTQALPEKTVRRFVIFIGLLMSFLLFLL